jgi:hypothetical protein
MQYRTSFLILTTVAPHRDKPWKRQENHLVGDTVRQLDAFTASKIT